MFGGIYWHPGATAKVQKELPPLSLTDREIRNSKPSLKSSRLYDERGLYLELSPSGGKWWRLKYRFDGKEKRLSLGVDSDVSLKDARSRRDEARTLLANGADPSANCKASKSAKCRDGLNSFEVVTREWFEKHSVNWVHGHSTRIIRLFERDIFPWIGDHPIAEVTAPDLLPIIRRIETRALETAHRALGNCGQVFRYAIATGRATRDPSADLRGALPPVRGSHFAATTEPKQLGAILRAMDGYEGSAVVRWALRSAPLLFVRPGELRYAEWKNFDFEAAEWRYTATKTKTPHIVPLSRQAIVLLEELRPSQGTAVMCSQERAALVDPCPTMPFLQP